MKKWNRFTSLVLCAALLLSLVGCTKAPAETTAAPTEPPTTAAPTEPAPDAREIYVDAREYLDIRENISLELCIQTEMTVDGQSYPTNSLQILTYLGLGTGTLSIGCNQVLRNGDHRKDFEAGRLEDMTFEDIEDPALYRQEVYSQNTLYIQANDYYFFSSQLEAEAALARYIPVVLLDAELYGEALCQETEDGMLLTFSQPTAAESWALPEEAELTDASGTVTLNDRGEIQQMSYSIAYTYGSAQYQVEIASRPMAKLGDVALYYDTKLYVPMEDIRAIDMELRAIQLLNQANVMSVSGLQSVFSQAAGVLRNQSFQLDVHDYQAKVEYGQFFMDYTSGESQDYDMEETFINGRYSVSENGFPAQTYSLDWDNMKLYCGEVALTSLIDMGYWTSASVTDLGSVYLIEFSLNEDFGLNTQAGISESFWADADFLMNLASKHETLEGNGYLSIDKYTGLPVAAGYYYQGVHTIQGINYVLTEQSDQSMEIPARGAYEEITDRKPEEAEPETKPTPLFYHVTGENGQEMWLLGTIHVGDSRTAYLPAEIRTALEGSTALALECDTEAFEEQVEEDDDLQSQVSDAYYYTDGTTLQSLMEEEDYKLAVQLAKATGSYNMNMPMAKPYLWSSSIDNFYLSQGHSLHSSQGVEERLTAWADELDKPIWEIESSLFQIQMLTGYSTELQLLLLEESMQTNGRESWESTQELYELWCSGDEAALINMINSEVDLSELTEEELAEYEAQKPLIDEYNKAISYDRNIGMLNKAIEYLESGDVVFYAVGLAHLLDGTNGLVQALRDAGYTVELVTYQ